MKMKVMNVYVDDQEKALRFYTEVLGFVKKMDFPGAIRWLTVVSPEEPDGPELYLEPNTESAAKALQQALFQQGKTPPCSTSTTFSGNTNGCKPWARSSRCRRLRPLARPSPWSTTPAAT